MFSPFGYAVACRRGEDVVVYKEAFGTAQALPQMGPISRFPFLRGIFAFVLSLGISLRAYFIANRLSSGEEESSEPLCDRNLLLKIVPNLLLGFVILVLLPDFLSHLLLPYSLVLMTLSETLLRIFLLILYVLVLSLFPAGERLLQYHGAEHKAINAFEKGAEMVPEEVDGYPQLHTRCGTTLFALILLLLFFLYLPFQYLPFFTRILLKTLILPFALPIAFELVYLAWRDERFSFFLAPGLLLQRITTKSPHKRQLEVAITALKEVVLIA